MLSESAATARKLSVLAVLVLLVTSPIAGVVGPALATGTGTDAPIAVAGNQSGSDGSGSTTDTSESPDASFSISEQRGVTAGEPITFDASASSDDGGIVSYEWSFPHTSVGSARGEQVTRAIDCAGAYSVTLTVTDAAGNTDTESKYLGVSQPRDSRDLVSDFEDGNCARTEGFYPTILVSRTGDGNERQPVVSANRIDNRDIAINITDSEIRTDDLVVAPLDRTTGRWVFDGLRNADVNLMTSSPDFGDNGFTLNTTTNGINFDDQTEGEFLATLDETRYDGRPVNVTVVRRSLQSPFVIYLNGTQVASVTDTSFTDSGLNANYLVVKEGAIDRISVTDIGNRRYIAEQQTIEQRFDGDDPVTTQFGRHFNYTYEYNTQQSGVSVVADFTLDLTSGSGDPTIALVGPDGTVRRRLDAAGGGAGERFDDVRLPSDGEWTFVVSGQDGSPTFDYRVTLDDLRRTSEGLDLRSISYNTTRAGEIDSDDPGRSQFAGYHENVTFDGTAGDVVNVTMAASADTRLALVGPGGSVVASDGGASGDAAITGHVLGTDGQYTIVAMGAAEDATFGYDLTLERAGRQTRPDPIELQPGTTVTGDVTNGPDDGRFGQRRNHTFPGQAGKLATVELNVTGGQGDGRLTLVAPDGSVTAAASGPGQNATISDAPLFTDGTYTVVVNATGSDPDFTYELTVTLSEPPRDLRAITYNTTKRGEIDARDPTLGRYGGSHENVTFEGNESDVVSLATSAATDTRLTLVGPDGGTVAADDDDGTGQNASIASLALPASGTYTVVVQGDAGSGTVPYDLTLSKSGVEQQGPLSDILVDDDGGADVDFRAIQPAVENATDDATITVRSGSYEESVTIPKNVTLVTTDSARLVGTAAGASTGFRIEAGSNAAPTIDGFVVAGFGTAVGARDTTGDWTLANITTERVTKGLDAADTTGDWTLRDSAIGSSSYPVLARGSTGNWTVSETRIGLTAASSSGGGQATQGSSGGSSGGSSAPETGRLETAGSTGDWTVANVTLRGSEGIGADDTAGDWVVRDVSITGGTAAAVSARRASGDWQVRNATISGHDEGIATGDDRNPGGGDWTVANVTIRDVGTGIDAAGAVGGWTVVDTTIQQSSAGLIAPGIDAETGSGGGAGSSGAAGGAAPVGGQALAVVENLTVTDVDGTGIDVSGATVPVRVRDSTVAEAGLGINASGTGVPWVVSDTNVTAADGDGIRARGAAGDWTVRASNVTGNGDEGIDATNSDGNWTVRETNVSANDDIGVQATSTGEDWTATDVEIADNRIGLRATGSTGDWTLADATVTGHDIGVDAGSETTPATGNWTLRNVLVAQSGTALDAAWTSGNWTVRNATLRQNDHGIEAANASGTPATAGGVATPSGSGSDAPGGAVAVTLRNVTVNGTENVALDFTHASVDVELRDAVVNYSQVGVDATSASGDWTLDEVNVSYNYGDGIVARETTGDWTIANSYVAEEQNGLVASESTGNWTITDTRFERLVYRAISGVRSTGDWRLDRVQLVDSAYGIDAGDAAGNWTVTGPSNISGNGAGVTATGVFGNWRINWTEFGANSVDILGTDANPTIDARHNWWGQRQECEGNVNCGSDLLNPPTASGGTVTVDVFQESRDVPYRNARVLVYPPDFQVSLAGITETVDVSTVLQHHTGDEIPAVLVGEERSLRTTAHGGRVVLNGLQAGEHCLVVAPPDHGTEDVRGRCLDVGADAEREETVVLAADGDGEWSQYQGGVTNRGTTDSDAPRRNTILRWSTELPDAPMIRRATVAANGHVYVIGESTLYALDDDTGTQQWSAPVGTAYSSPAVAGSTVYVYGDGFVRAYDSQTGALRWETDVTIPSEVAYSHQGNYPGVTVTDERVLVTTNKLDGRQDPQRNHVVALDRESGNIVWNTTVYGTQSVMMNPTVSRDHGLLYVGGYTNYGSENAKGSRAEAALSAGLLGGAVTSGATAGGALPPESWLSTGQLVALDIQTGDVAWRATTNYGGVSAPPTLGDGRLYTPIANGSILVSDPATGDRIDMLNLPADNRINDADSIFGSPALVDDTLVVSTGNQYSYGSPHQLYGLDPDTGDQRWQRELPGGLLTAPAVVDGTVYVGTFRRPGPNGIYAVDARTGRTVREYQPAGGRPVSITSSPAVAGGTLYVADEDGNVTAIGAPDWAYRLQHDSDDGSFDRYDTIGRVDPVQFNSDLQGRLGPAAPAIGTNNGTTVRYTATGFTGTAGERVTVEMNGPESSRLLLVGPGGDVVAAAGGYRDLALAGAIPHTQYRLEEVRLPETGDYAVVVASNLPMTERTEGRRSFNLRLNASEAAAVSRSGDGVTIETPRPMVGQTYEVTVPEGASDRVERFSVEYDRVSPLQPTFDVSVSTDRPSDAPQTDWAGDPVFLQVEHDDVTDPQFAGGSVTIELPREQVDDPQAVTVYRYDDGWQSVSTTPTGQTPESYYFRIDTPGFSTFVVATDGSEPPTLAGGSGGGSGAGSGGSGTTGGSPGSGGASTGNGGAGGGDDSTGTGDIDGDGGAAGTATPEPTTAEPPTRTPSATTSTTPAATRTPQPTAVDATPSPGSGSATGTMTGTGSTATATEPSTPTPTSAPVAGDPAADTTVEISGDPAPGSGFPVVPVAAGLGLVVVAGGGFLWLRRQS